MLGDARLSLDGVPDGRFGLVALDAFSSDAIPVHLLTREAVAGYLRTLRPGGVLAVHVSNRWLRLEGPVAAIAAELGLHGRIATDNAASDAQLREHKTASSWIALARDEAALAPLAGLPGWRALEREPGVGRLDRRLLQRGRGVELALVALRALGRHGRRSAHVGAQEAQRALPGLTGRPPGRDGRGGPR